MLNHQFPPYLFSSSKTLRLPPPFQSTRPDLDPSLSFLRPVSSGSPLPQQGMGSPSHPNVHMSSLLTCLSLASDVRNPIFCPTAILSDFLGPSPLAGVELGARQGPRTYGMLFSKATKFWDGMRVLIVKFKCKLESQKGRMGGGESHANSNPIAGWAQGLGRQSLPPVQAPAWPPCGLGPRQGQSGRKRLIGGAVGH